MSDLRVLADQQDLRLTASRRAFPVAQSLLAGGTTSTPISRATVGWFGTSTYPETGAAAVIREGHPLEEDLVGTVIEIVRIEPPEARSAFLYVVAARPIEADLDLSITRRAYLALGLLSEEALPARVGLVR